MQGFIEPKLHPSADAIVVFYYSVYIKIFFAIKSDKNPKKQSKFHRNSNYDKNSIYKRIIVWYKFLLCCGNTSLHMFMSCWLMLLRKLSQSKYWE